MNVTPSQVDDPACAFAEKHVPRGYKQTEVGVIPEDWGVVPLSREIEGLDAGVSVNSVDEELRIYPHDQLILKTSAIIGGQFLPKESKKIAPRDLSRARLSPRSDTIIISRMNTPDLVGECGYVSTDYPNLFLPDRLWMTRVCKGSDVYVKWLNYLLSSRPYKGRIKGLATGTSGSMKNIAKDLLLAMPIPYPRPHEQEAIADALSDADALIESMEQLLAKKRQIKQGAMQELLTGKKRLPAFSGEWDSPTLGDLFTFKNGLNKGKRFFGHGTPIVNYMDVYGKRGIYAAELYGRVSLSKEELRAFEVRKGDVFFTRTSETAEEVGITSVMLDEPRDTVFSGFVLRARPKDDSLHDQFKQYCFSSAAVRKQITSQSTETTRALTNGRYLSAVAIMRPPKAEQVAIAAALSHMDAEIVALEEKLAKAHMIKQGMVQELLTGRIRLPLPSAKSHSALPKQQRADKHSAHFNEAVVLAIVVHYFGSEEHPLGRFRRTKFSYLLHRHVEHEAPGFLKKAAGPYNPTVRYGGAEKIALNRGYVLERKSEKANGFVAGDKITQAKGYFEKWYGAEALRWLEQFRYVKNDDLELLTTVDMTFQDLRRAGGVADLAAVKKIIGEHPEWNTKLRKPAFSDEKIDAAIKKCREIFGENQASE